MFKFDLKINFFLCLGDHNETTNLILDHLTFSANLTEMNQQLEEFNSSVTSEEHISLLNYTANMTLEYSAMNDLQLQDMSPNSWWNYVKRMAKSSTNICVEKVS